MLLLQKVTKAYSSQFAIRSLHLQVSEGESHILLGPSGSGKSTILKLIMGLIRPEQGDIQLGNDWLSLVEKQEWVRKIGYVPQDGGLFPHLNAEQNATIVAKSLHWKKSRIQERISEVAKLVSMPDNLLVRYPYELSGGQKQRVAIMRALFLDPKLLLFDEPLANIDPLLRLEIQTELRTLFKKLNKTVLTVTHDIGEAAYLGDRVSMICNGSILQSGPMSELIKRPADPFVTQFINAQKRELTQ